MTRFIHDQFAKDYLEELLSPYGKVESSKRVASEAREVDVWFAPSATTAASSDLGLLGKLALTPAIFEPFRNAVTGNEILDCVLKLLEIRGQLQREANRNKTNLDPTTIPRLWILTPTGSDQLLLSFGATMETLNWGYGVYVLAPAFRCGIVVIHDLPETSETLWLRILGRGRVQKKAIDEVVALREDHPYRQNTLKLLISLQKQLNINPTTLDTDERELIMRLLALYQQDREQAVQEGRQEGRQEGQEQERRQVIQNLLLFRFGELDAELSSIIDRLVALTPEEFTPLLLTRSRGELLERFSG